MNWVLGLSRDVQLHARLTDAGNSESPLLRQLDEIFFKPLASWSDANGEEMKSRDLAGRTRNVERERGDDTERWRHAKVPCGR